MTNSGAIEQTINCLYEQGVLTDVHAALIAATRTLAMACDTVPSNSQLWKEYRAAISSLMDLAEDDSGDTESFVSSVRASLGHAQN